MKSLLLALTVSYLLLDSPSVIGGDKPLWEPLFHCIDLDVGQSREVTLADGTTATVKLLGIKETRDPVRQALRGAEVTVEVNGIGGVLPCATYHLPTQLGGVRIDCPVIKGYLRSYSNYWSIDRDARFRIWPAEGPFIRPDTFQCPLEQRWGAAGTLFDNEIGDGETSGSERVYYHQGFDFGGADRLAPIYAATDGVVVSARANSIDDIPECVRPRYDVVYVRDPRGWYYRYSHFDAIDPGVQVGAKVSIGQQIGILGKEGGSGGWSHLHFELIRPQENGKFGSDSMYAFLHQVYQAKNDEPVIAVARPQILSFVGQPIVLDGSRSWSVAGGQGMKHQWSFDDGTKATGAKVEHVYARPGRFRPTLKVTDAEGHVDYDFGKVTVADPDVPPAQRCYLHASYWPTKNIRAGDEVTFLVRSFRFQPPQGDEVWDFGDGSPVVCARSDGAVNHRNKDGYAVTKHRFERSGYYIVTVRRSNDDGQWAVDKLDVRVEPVVAERFHLRLRYQKQTSKEANSFQRLVREENWEASETAVVVCDVWDLHHCLNAVRRLEQFGRSLNEVLIEARRRGAVIIHSPSDCMTAYRDHPARRRAIAAPRADTLPEDINSWCSRIPAEERADYPIDQSDGGEDDDPEKHAAWAAKLKAMGRNPGMPWKTQSSMISIDAERDYISDRGEEVWNILEQRGIRNVILTGVHTNMCVLGRPFGLRQMSRNGKNAVLMRDMTDTMYNPKRWPYVDHFTATDLIVSHIERYVCPTITSDQLIGGESFRFRKDSRKQSDIMALASLPQRDVDLLANTWSPVMIPAPLDSVARKAIRESRGVAWFRCAVRVRKSWMADRPLRLQVPTQASKVTAWCNGHPLTSPAGNFPETIVFQIDPGSVTADDANLIVLRVELGDGPAFTAAPRLAAGDTTMILEGRWQFRAADNPTFTNMPLPARFGASPDILFEK